jgi:tetratricopeptide (TPR) repeat protein
VDDSLERSKLILDAITHLRTAIGFNPRYTKAHLQLGNVLITAGKTQALLDEGKQHLQETIRLAPASAEAQQAQKLLQKLGKPQ